MAWYGYEIGNKPRVDLFDSNSMPLNYTIMNYHTFWTNFNTELYKKIVEQRKQADKRLQKIKDLENHLKTFVI